MSLELLDAHPVEEGIALTFATEHGLESLTGSCEEVARLAEVMQQISVIAPLNNAQQVWIADVVVGDDRVRLGLNPGGQARVLIERPVIHRSP